MNSSIKTEYLTLDIIVIREDFENSDQSVTDLISDFEDALKEKKIFENEEERIIIIKMILSMLPQSTDLIYSILDGANTTDIDYEIQFTLFCYLDKIDSLNFVSESVKNKILDKVENYLINALTEKADAAWMAGDMLGAHWNVIQSKEVLQRILENAKSNAGKKAAVYGLYQLSRRDKSQINLLQDIYLDNKYNSEIQEYAQFLYDKIKDVS